MKEADFQFLLYVTNYGWRNGVSAYFRDVKLGYLISPALLRLRDTGPSPIVAKENYHGLSY